MNYIKFLHILKFSIPLQLLNIYWYLISYYYQTVTSSNFYDAKNMLKSKSYCKCQKHTKYKHQFSVTHKIFFLGNKAVTYHEHENKDRIIACLAFHTYSTRDINSTTLTSRHGEGWLLPNLNPKEVFRITPPPQNNTTHTVIHWAAYRC